MLETRLKDSQNCLKEYDKQLANSHDTADILDITVQSSECQQTCDRLSALIHSKRGTLGVSEKAQLRRLRDDEFLQVKLNTRAVKI